MADESKKDTVTLQELMVSTLAMTDAAVKLLIKKGVFTDEEFTTQLGAERANYLAVLKRLHSRAASWHSNSAISLLADSPNDHQQIGLGVEQCHSVY